MSCYRFHLNLNVLQLNLNVFCDVQFLLITFHTILKQAWHSILERSSEVKQVALRATIAHLSPMCQHPLISNKPASKVIKKLKSFQIRELLFFSGLSTSNVSRLNVPEIKPLVVFKHVLVTKEQASMETSLSHYNSLEYFSNTQAPLIPQ